MNSDERIWGAKTDDLASGVMWEVEVAPAFLCRRGLVVLLEGALEALSCSVFMEFVGFLGIVSQVELDLAT